MLQFHNTTDDERKRSNSQTAVLPVADARAYGMMTARTVNGGRKFPRTSSAEHTSDCIVTTASGSQYTIKRGASRKPSTNKAVRQAQSKRDNAAQYERMMRLGIIGNTQ